jgi:hypothetical protein
MHDPNLNTPAEKHTSLALKLSLYFIPFACGLIYWLAFFPGVMSYDSVFQWDQLSTLQITNWHPAIHTIMMWFLTRIWYSPAIVSLFQVIIASLVIGYGLNSIRKASQLPGYLFIGLSFVISANPLVGVMNVTLWKDVLYSYNVLLLAILILNIVRSDGEWILKSTHLILLGSTLASIWLFRFNGFPVVLSGLIILVIIYKKYFRHFAYASLISFILMLFVLSPLYTIFKVNVSLSQNYGLSFLNPIVSYVKSKPYLAYLSENEKQYLQNIYPLDKPWNYSCYDATVFFYGNTNLYPVIRDPLTVVKIFTKLAFRDPKIMLNHFLCLSSFVWQLNQPHNVYLETILFDTYDLDQTPSWLVYKDVINQSSLLPEVRGLIKRVVGAEWHRDSSMILWRPAVYMYLFLASLAFFVYRTGRKNWLLISIPMIAQSVVIMFTSQLQALRYQYSVYLISMVFTIPLIIMGIKRTESMQSADAGSLPGDK